MRLRNSIFLMLLLVIGCWTEAPKKEVNVKFYWKHKKVSCKSLNEKIGQMPEPPNLTKECGDFPDMDDDINMRIWNGCSAYQWSIYASTLEWWISVAIATCMDDEANK